MGGVLVGVAVMLLITSGQASAIVTNLWLSHWMHRPLEEEQERRYIYVYIALVAVVIVLSVRACGNSQRSLFVWLFV